MDMFDENANSVWWFCGDPMSLNGDVQKIRAKQVGVLMRHYRSSFRAEDGRTGLTMEDVLERMAKANQRYESSAPSTVSRWESGATMPKRRRLQEFGAALNLSPHEIDGLAALAGIDAESRLDPARAAVSAVGRHQDVAASATGSGRLIPQIGGVFGQRSIRSLLVQALQGSIFQFLLPLLAIAGAGYLLSSQGITETWILMLYIGIAMGLVVFQRLLRMRRADSLRDLLFMSLFVVLSAPLTQIPFVHTDHYGLYILSGSNDSAKLILLSLIACLSMALIASLAFDLLWRWQYSGRGATKAHHRAVWVVAPPVAFVYLCILLLGPLGAWIEYLFVLSVLTGVFITLALLRDQTITLSIWDRRFLLWSAFMTILVLTAIGAAAVLVGYSEFSVLSAKGHTLIHSWDVDYSTWGYSQQELVDRSRVSFLWNATLVLAYMVIVVGGTFMATIYRLETTDTGTPTADIGELPARATTHPTPRKGRIKSLFVPGRLAGSPIYSSAG
jgi:transcriptional regulator with XRE-family HTH domain